MNDLFNPSEDELRRSLALIAADALRWTEKPSEGTLKVLREIMLALASTTPVSVLDEKHFIKSLLSSGARITGSFNGEEFKKFFQEDL